MTHIDVVAYVNTYEIVEKSQEELKTNYPKFVKYIKTIGDQVGKIIQKANEVESLNLTSYTHSLSRHSQRQKKKKPKKKSRRKK